MPPPPGTETSAAGRRSLAGGALLYAVQRVAIVSAAALVSVIVARLLGAGGSGEFALVSTLLLMLVIVSSIGLDLGAIWLVAGGRWGTHSALRSMAVAALVLGLAGGLAGAAFYLAARETVFEGIPLVVAAPAFAAVIPALIWTYLSQVALARERYEAAVAIPGVQALGYVVAVAVLGAIFGIAGATAGLFAGHLLAAIAAAIWALRAARAEPAAGIDAGALRTAARFGLRAYGAQLLIMMQLRLDVLILGAFVTSAAVGHYAVAVAITMVLPILPNALGSVLFPRIARLKSEPVEPGAITATVTKALRHATAIALAGSLAVVFVLAFLVTPIWGPEFAESRGLGLILVPGAAALCVGGVAYSALNGLGHPNRVLQVGLFAAPLALVLYALMIPAWGTVGAATASTISYIAGAAFALRLLWIESGTPTPAMLLPSGDELADYRRLLAAVVRAAPFRRTEYLDG